MYVESRLFSPSAGMGATLILALHTIAHRHIPHPYTHKYTHTLTHTYTRTHIHINTHYLIHTNIHTHTAHTYV